MSNIRLFVDNPNLNKGDSIILNEKQSHYITNVMKLKTGELLHIFNGKDGEFSAQIMKSDKKKSELYIDTKTKNFTSSPDLWLLFAPLKKDCTDIVIQKSTELGVSRIIPTITKNTITNTVRTDRFELQALEASEQCGRVDVPTIEKAESLNNIIKNWNKERKLILLDETGNGQSAIDTLKNLSGPCAILIGPEGGFDKKELETLRNLEYTHSISLGARILRAETAAIAAISCWQAICGDWKL